MKQNIVTIFLISIFVVIIGVIALKSPVPAKSATATWWQFQAIDTMKYSRDLSREKLNDRAFEHVIASQVQNIAATGATHVAIATPYDEEFMPILIKWVEAARANKLKVWFRGNWSGWEGWFNYPKISRDQHIEKTVAFIKAHPDLFQDGDIFSACPECENGGPVDAQIFANPPQYRKFIIDGYTATIQAFTAIGKKVAANYYSMNGDVARLIMDKPTTQALDGVVVIDHYVKTPQKLADDIRALATSSGGKIVLGEFGAPIPDIHGNFDDAAQAKWVGEALEAISDITELVGISYWTNVGGSTALWNTDGSAHSVVGVLTAYFRPRQITGVIRDELNKPIKNSTIKTHSRMVTTDKSGNFTVTVKPTDTVLEITQDQYSDQTIVIVPNQNDYHIRLIKLQKTWYERLLLPIFRLFNH